jgi:hypothetical protein
MIRSPILWLTALWLGLLVHVDWHLARPLHHRLSFGLEAHWLLGVGAAFSVGWIVARRWPRSPARAAALIVALGVLMGQGLEPLGEVVTTGWDWEPLQNPQRWRAVGEFLAATVLSLPVALIVFTRRSRVFTP